MNVFLMVHEDRHGTGYSIFANEKTAERAKAQLARDNWAYRPRPDDTLYGELAIMTDDEVIESYFQDNEREWVDIEAYDVIGAP